MRRRVIAALTVGLTAALFVLVGSGFTAGATTTTQGPTYAFSQSETISRTFNNEGTVTVADAPSLFTANVSQTSNLFGRQEVQVSWSGAHPTGGIASNESSIDAQDEEYPVVLLECRGVDSTSPPSGQEQLSPETCWTQDWSERYQDSYSDLYPAYRLDEYATPADTQAIVGAPATNPAVCAAQDQYVPGDGADPAVQYWLPWQAADGTVYYGGNDGCGGQPPEADVTGGLPSNETFGATDAQGNGSADFDVFTSEENQTLGCSTTVACSLEIVPIMGLSCAVTSTIPAADVVDPAGTPEGQGCEDTGAYSAGSDMNTSNILSDLSVSGSLWWSASNWRNRISVPLSFATTASDCSLTGTTASNSIDVYGSELMIRATDQWEPYFCLGDDHDDDFSFVHVQTGEPEARNLVAAGTAEAAFTEDAQPGGYPVPTVNAPVAFSGFTISYDISGEDGQPYQNLKLTPLLLAKLLTESYPDSAEYAGYNKSIGKNPQNITQDPEFEQLNPGVPLQYGVDAAAELDSLSSDSDVIEGLTTYINDDPAARAWLDGTSSGEPNACNSSGQYAVGASDPCPAMVVNPAYKNIQLPVDQWPLLAPLDPTAFYSNSGNPCLQASPVPFLDIVASPVATLEDITEDMQFEQPNSEVACDQNNGSAVGEKLVPDPPESAGQYFMLGITPLGDDYPYALQPALLQTTPGTFVGPTTAALQSTASLLQPDAQTGTWPIPYSEFETTAGQAAYPGAMVVYAAVPTKGLPTGDAADLGQLLQFAATTGQQQGTSPGQLPPGYLPLTAANGLAGLASYTEAAAVDVTAQNGEVPSLTGATTPNSEGPVSTSGTNPTSSAPFGDGQSDNGQSAAFTTPSATSASHPSSSRKVHVVAVLQSPIQTSAERLRDWLDFMGADGLLVALLGLVILPSLLVVGRRRGKW